MKERLSTSIQLSPTSLSISSSGSPRLRLWQVCVDFPSLFRLRSILISQFGTVLTVVTWMHRSKRIPSGSICLTMSTWSRLWRLWDILLRMASRGTTTGLRHSFIYWIDIKEWVLSKEKLSRVFSRDFTRKVSWLIPLSSLPNSRKWKFALNSFPLMELQAKSKSKRLERGFPATAKAFLRKTSISSQHFWMRKSSFLRSSWSTIIQFQTFLKPKQTGNSELARFSIASSSILRHWDHCQSSKDNRGNNGPKESSRLKIKSNSSKDVNTSRSSSLSIKRSPRRMRSLFFTTTATSNQERRRLFLS